MTNEKETLTRRVSSRRVISSNFAVIIIAALSLLVVDIVFKVLNSSDTGFSAQITDIQDPSVLSDKLDFLADHDGPSIVVIGDSVVFGETMAESGDVDWRSNTIDRKLARRLNSEADIDNLLVLNLGLNGAVPMDMERLSYAAFAAGADMLVMDVSLRSFSEDFEAPDNQFSRDWLRNYLRGGGETLSSSWELFRLRRTLQWGAFKGPPSVHLQTAMNAANSILSSNQGGTVATNEDLLLTLKARKRYASSNFEVHNPQRASLSRIVEASRDLGVPVVFFYATENPNLIDQIIAPEKRKALIKELEVLVNAEKTHFVGPLEIPADEYLDQVHTTSKGYDIVADALMGPIFNLGVKDLRDSNDDSLRQLVDRYYRAAPEKPFKTHDASRKWSGNAINLFDGAGPFQKGGSLVLDGLQMERLRSHPVVAQSLLLHTTIGKGILKWSLPEQAIVPSPSIFSARLNTTNSVSDLAFILSLFDGRSVVMLVKGDSDRLNLPEGSVIHTPMDNSGGENSVTQFDLSEISGQQISTMGLHLYSESAPIELGERSEAPVSIHYAGFAYSTLSRNEIMMALGQVRGAVQGRVNVRSSNGKVIASARANAQGKIILPNLPANELLSIYHEAPSGKRTFTEYGRWSTYPSGVVDIVMDTRRSNSVGVNFNTPSFRDPRTERNYRRNNEIWQGARAPNAPARWVGYKNVPNEYDTLTYANNLGYFDQDQFLVSRGNCLRVLWMGTSGVEAVQSTIANRHSTMLEEELGLRIGRCVEVIAAAPGITIRDKDVVEALIDKFSPDVAMFFTNSPDFELLSPEYHFLSRGWDPKNSAQASFYKDERGDLKWRPSNPAYAQFVKKAPRPQFNGIEITLSLLVPPKFRDPKAKLPFEMFETVANYYSEKYPDVIFVMEITTQQAVCSQSEAWRCDITRRDNDGNEFSVSPDSFVENVKNVCLRTPFICVGPKTPDMNGQPYPRLMYMFDSHFSPFGHQWVATELANLLAEELPKEVTK